MFFPSSCPHGSGVPPQPPGLAGGAGWPGSSPASPLGVPLNVALVGPAGVRNYQHCGRRRGGAPAFRPGLESAIARLPRRLGSARLPARSRSDSGLVRWLARRLPLETAFWCGVGLSLLLAWHSLNCDHVLAFPSSIHYGGSTGYGGQRSARRAASRRTSLSPSARPG
jgi:hypothetical protein